MFLRFPRSTEIIWVMMIDENLLTVVDFLQDVVDYGYVEGKEEVGVVLEPKDQVPPLAVPLAILK